MDRIEALKLMESSKNVNEWNENRGIVLQGNQHSQLMSDIDCKGLIVKVLGVDAPRDHSALAKARCEEEEILETI